MLYVIRYVVYFNAYYTQLGMYNDMMSHFGWILRVNAGALENNTSKWWI